MFHFFHRDLKEELSTLQGKEVEMVHKKSDLEKQLEVAEAETLTVRNELKTAQKRIEDLQVAISGEIDSDTISDQVKWLTALLAENIRCSPNTQFGVPCLNAHLTHPKNISTLFKS